LNDLGQALADAVRMIASADPEIVAAVSASLRFSLSSTILASLLGIPIGILLATSRVRFKRVIEGVLNSLLAMPTVVVGLFVYALIFRQGPLGDLHLLFSPSAIILGQTILIVPLITALACSAVEMINPIVQETALTLGAGRLRTSWTVAAEAQTALIVAGVTAFGRVIGEVGISILLGGNILGYTRTITTAVALQTSKGEFAAGLALGIILMLAALAVNIAVRLLGRKTA
jgi:tungstate transport system permease protein